MAEKRIAESILYPPEKYDKIKNRFGRSGLKPNLYFNNTIHSLHVNHVYELVVEHGMDVDDYIKNYNSFGYAERSQLIGIPKEGENNKVDEMRESINQAIDFYEEFQEELGVLDEISSEEIREIIEE